MRTKTVAMGFLPLSVLLMVASCSTPSTPPAPEPVVVTREVRVPVAVPCRPTTPTYSDPAPDAAVRATTATDDLLLLLGAARLLYRQRITELDAALSGCGGG